MTKKRKGLLATLIFIIGVLLILIFTGWMLDRQTLVAEGLAKPKFPYLKYSQQELFKIYGTNEPADIMTTQSPEQTHAIFMAHLKANEIDEAVECCFRRGEWGETKEFIQRVKDEGKFDTMVSDLSVIEKDLMFDATAVYLYDGTYKGEKVGNVIEFIKDSSGKWLIKGF